MAYNCDDEGLGIGLDTAAQFVGGIFKKKSARYGGGDGPLYSTVNGFITRIASGDTAVIKQLDQLRKTDKDKVQWSLFWETDMLRQPLTPAQVQLIVSLDPSKAGLQPQGGSAMLTSPSGETVSAPAPVSGGGGGGQYVSPGAAPMTAGLFSSPLVLGGIALAAVMMLQGGKKRRR